MDLLSHQKRLEEFLDIVDPPRRSSARELLLSLKSEEELFNLLEEQYGEFFRSKLQNEQKEDDSLEDEDADEYEDEDDSSAEAETRPVCQYGRECYRKNPVHFQEFAHPWLDE